MNSGANATLPSTDEIAVLREQVRLIYAHLPVVLIGNLVTSLGVVVALWTWSSPALLLAWAAAVWFTCLVRLLVRRAFQREGSGFDAGRWGRIATMFSGLSGCLWGAMGVLFFQPEAQVVMVIVVVLGGMAAGSVSAHSCFLPAYVMYVVPTVVPFALRCIAEVEGFYIILGVLSLTFVAVNINYGKNLQRSLKESIRLRFHNSELVAALTRQKELAERASMAKTKFLAAASHDLRQPVQTIEFLVDALEHDLATHPARTLVDRIRLAGRGLESLLNALLDFSRIDAAAIVPEPRNFSAAELLESLRAEFTPLAEGRGIALRVVPTRAWLQTDLALLERVLRNFISNAIKFTPLGTVLIGCRRTSHGVRIEVHDTGIGIPVQAQQDVFRDFYQLDNPERDREKGLGLGLSIASGLANLLGLPLRLRSTPGRGSTFSVTVPFGQAEHASSPVPAATPMHDLLQGKTVLLIDDDAAIRSGAAEMLERWGCTAVAVESAAEAVELIALTGFEADVIVADYRLRGGMNGVDAIHAVRARCGNVPAAILTGDTAPDRLREARSSGFPLLSKPLTAAKLRTLLAGLLAQSGQAQRTPSNTAAETQARASTTSN